MPLNLFYITNNPQIALIAEKYGVDRIWIDLETLGKEQRQHNMNTVKSHHTVSDVSKVKSVLTSSELLVRVNPWNPESENEIDEVINRGADIIMLPMWKSVSEVSQFIAAVNNRVKTTILLETAEAVECIDEVLELSGIDEIHIGLNDLHLSYGLDFMFELLSNGVVERLCSKFKAKGIPFGFGGIARLGNGQLKSERVIMEHYRLGSTRAILSRSFCNTEELSDIEQIEELFKVNMQQLRNYEKLCAVATNEDLLKNKEEISMCVNRIVKSKGDNLF